MKRFTNQKYYITSIIVGITITVGIFIYVYKPKIIDVTNQKISTKENIPIQKTSPPKSLYDKNDKKIFPIANTESKIINNVSPSIVLSTGNINVQLIINPNQTLYQILNDKKNINKISFSGKNYSGLGFFITDIGDLHSGNGKNLFYYINGKEASVGISSYIPKEGDVVLWKLE